MGGCEALNVKALLGSAGLKCDIEAVVNVWQHWSDRGGGARWLCGLRLDFITGSSPNRHGSGATSPAKGLPCRGRGQLSPLNTLSVYTVHGKQATHIGHWVSYSREHADSIYIYCCSCTLTVPEILGRERQFEDGGCKKYDKRHCFFRMALIGARCQNSNQSESKRKLQFEYFGCLIYLDDLILNILYLF